MLGQRIALLRRQAGLSQSELAVRLGISPSAVGMYEQGRREPSVDTLVEMARVFDVSTDYLLTGRIADLREARQLEELLRQRVQAAEERLAGRGERPFTHQELAVLFAAMLLE